MIHMPIRFETLPSHYIGGSRGARAAYSCEKLKIQDNTSYDTPSSVNPPTEN